MVSTGDGRAARFASPPWPWALETTRRHSATHPSPLPSVPLHSGTRALSSSVPSTPPSRRSGTPSWRGRPPEEALNWVREVSGGGQILSVRLLPVGGWHANHAITVLEPKGMRRQVVLRRWARPGWDVEDPDFTASREIRVLGLLERAGLPAPRLIGADPMAATCDVPALLVTRLTGHPPGRVRDVETFLVQLAEILARIHHIGAASAEIPAFRTYFPMREAHLPGWLLGDPVWEGALAAAHEAEASADSFIHRDYHPGNSLWRYGTLTGVVDWTQASLGPVGVDVGSMRWNLAADFGLRTADRFLDAYRASSDLELRDQPVWDLVTLMDVVLGMSGPGPDDEMGSLRSHAEACLHRIGG